MIIKMTVKNNDYITTLESFSENLLNRILFPDFQYSDTNYSDLKWYEISKERRKLIPILNSSKTISEEDKNLLIKALYEEWVHYVKKVSSGSTLKYPIENFQVTIGYLFEDKWENGEVIYYFTTNHKYIMQ